MIFLVSVLLQFAFLAVSESVPFQDCGSVYEIRNVDIEGCGSRVPCFITSGDRVEVNLEFDAGSQFRARNLGQNVVIDINTLHLTPEVTPERCETCPAQSNGPYTFFSSAMTIPNRIALNQRGYLRWQITNQQGQLIVCYSVLVQTQSRLQKHVRLYAETFARGQNANTD